MDILKKPLVWFILAATISGCGGSGTADLSTNSGSNTNSGYNTDSYSSSGTDDLPEIGSVFEVNNQKFLVHGISGDGQRITVKAYINGFLQSADVVTFDLEMREGIFRYDNDFIYIEYSPSNNNVYWYVKPSINGTSLEDLRSGFLEAGGTIEVSSLPGFDVGLSDIDGDSIADIFDNDSDGDGFDNDEDPFPLDGTEYIDTDGDGFGNNSDTDDDADGIPDFLDSKPLDANEGYSPLDIRESDSLLAEFGKDTVFTVSKYNHDEFNPWSNSIELIVKDDSDANSSRTVFLYLDEETGKYVNHYGAVYVEYDPATGIVSAFNGADIEDLGNSDIGSYLYLADLYDLDFMTTLHGKYVGQWTPGSRSTSDVNAKLTSAQNFVDTEVEWMTNNGFYPQFSSDFSYDAINVAGLEAAHKDGWSGLGANVYVVDGFEGSAGPFYDLYIDGSVDQTHGAQTFSLSYAIAPEANFELIEAFGAASTDPFLPYLTYGKAIEIVGWGDMQYGPRDYNADVVNLSLGVHLTDYPSIENGLINAAGFVSIDLENTAWSLPNAVIVQAAGNNGAITNLSIDRGCVSSGGRNTASSCTDAIFSLSTDYYSYLDRTIWVGSLDTETNQLTDYSVSAGLTADHFIVADGYTLDKTAEGTSFAAPRVTGALALVAQKFPDLNAIGRKGVILETATDLGDPGVDPVYGHGLLNVTNALNPIGMLK